MPPTSRKPTNALPEADAAAFEEHLLLCAECRAAVEEADELVRAMRAAAVQIRY